MRLPNPMATQIKGLSQFIADLRSSTSTEAEKARVHAELAALRKKVSSGNKSLGSKSKTGYEHRKVVSKLLYIYILGYDVDLGSDEILALIQMPKFAEKQVGYLALGMLLHSDKRVRDLVHNQVIDDLRSTKESIVSVALNYLSTWDSKTALSEELADLLYRLLVSPTSSSSVVKKSALTILYFFKDQPDTFMHDFEEWSIRLERICAILAGPNLGVSTSVTSLLIGIAKIAPHSFNINTTRVVSNKLTEVFEEHPDDSQEYVYYNSAAPWLVSKLCRLLTLLPISGDSVYDLRKTVAPVLMSCVESANQGTNDSKTNKSRQASSSRNAKNFVFFEAISLANHIQLSDWDFDLAISSLQMTRDLLLVEDTTLRYSALQALSSFPTPHPGPKDPDLLERVLKLVKDRDISVRRKAIDALYVLVDSESIEGVAARLLDLLVASDLQIRPQMVARLAALIERFANSHEWYLDTCIQLLVIGGSYAGDEVWQRLVQVIVNNEALHHYAVKRLYESITTPQKGGYPHGESLLKVASFVFGEFSMVYQGEISELFVALQDHINSTKWSTKVMMFTTYAKLACRSPELRPSVIETLQVYRNAPHLETQQRANELLWILKPENVDIQPLLLEPMPPFGEHSTRDLFTRALKPQNTAVIPTAPVIQPTLSVHQKPLAPTPIERSVSESTTASSWPAFSDTSQKPLVPAQTGEKQISLSSNWEYGYKRMLTHPDAVLYQDAILQVGCQYEFNNSNGLIKLFVKNISGFTVSSLLLQVNNPMKDEVLSLELESPRNVGTGTLQANQSFVYIIKCNAKQPFALTPTCRITFLAGTFLEIGLKLPIVLERFMTPSIISAEEFQQRWDQLGPQLEFQKMFKNNSSSTNQKTVMFNSSNSEDVEIVKGLQYGIVSGSPPPTTFGAGIIHTTNGGMFGALIVVQPDASRSNYKVTVRTTRKKIAAVVLANNIAQAYTL